MQFLRFYMGFAELSDIMMSENEVIFASFISFRYFQNIAFIVCFWCLFAILSFIFCALKRNIKVGLNPTYPISLYIMSENVLLRKNQEVEKNEWKQSGKPAGPKISRTPSGVEKAQESPTCSKSKNCSKKLNIQRLSPNWRIILDFFSWSEKNGL